MAFLSLAGNGQIREQLSRTEERGRLSHAYILSGPRGSGRHTLARLLAAAMECTAAPGGRPCGTCAQCKKTAAGIHPDVKVQTGPGPGKPITVDQIRALRADAYIRPNEGARKVYLLENAETMNPSAQNAMLKLLEEGPPYAVFLLLTENSGALLQTVCSRCEELSLSPVSLPECRRWLRGRFPDRPAAELERAALDCQGILGRAAEALAGSDDHARERRERAEALAAALERGSESELFRETMVLDKAGREELLPLLDALIEALAARLTAAPHSRRLFRAVELTRQLRAAAQRNVNAGQLAGWLCAGMFQEEIP